MWKQRFEELNQLKDKYSTALKRGEWSKDFFSDLKNEITYHSNKLEGLAFSYGETISFLKYGLVDQKNSANLRIISALKNHQKLLDKIFEQYQDLQITEEAIKEINKELLQDPSVATVNDPLEVPGEYKEHINGRMILVDGKAVYKEYLPPVQVPQAMKNFVKEINSCLKNIDLKDPRKHPVTLATYFHYVFTNEIHPFPDGNGRTARLYSNLILMKNAFPAIAIKGEKQDRENYIKAIQASSKENLSPLLKVFTKQLKETMERGLKIYEIQQNSKSRENKKHQGPKL